MLENSSSNIYLINNRKYRKESCVAKGSDIDFSQNCYYEVLNFPTLSFMTPSQFFNRIGKTPDYLFFNKYIPLDGNNVLDLPFEFTIFVSKTSQGVMVKNPKRKDIEVLFVDLSKKVYNDDFIIPKDGPNFFSISEDGHNYPFVADE